MSEPVNPVPNPVPDPSPVPTAPPPYSPAPYAAPVPAYRPRPPKRKEPVSRKDLAFALVFFLFSVLWADFALLHGFRLGFSIVTILFFVLMTAYLIGRGIRLRFYPVCCGLLAAAGSIPFSLYYDAPIQLVSFGTIAALFALYGSQLTGCFRHSPGGFRCIADVLSAVFVYPFEYMGVTLRSLFFRESRRAGTNAEPDAAQARREKSGGKILIGALCAVPALAILIPLMARSDLYFEQLLTHLSINIPELVGRFFLGAILFLPLFSLLFTWKKKLPQSSARSASTELRLVDPVIIQSFLSVLSLVYLVYLLTQTAYFFSAFRGLLPQGYEQSVTDYARRGFFEMCAIAAINLGILFLSLVLVRKEAGKIPLFTRVLGSFLCLFTILLTGTALSKMFLYIDRYGMTRLRLITSCFMVFLALVFVAAGIRLWIRKFPYMKAIVLIFCAVGLTVSYSDIDATVARYNVAAYHSGALETVDVDALSGLSDSAVPYLLELLDDDDPQVAGQVHNELVHKLFSHFDVTCGCPEEDCPCDREMRYLWERSGSRDSASQLMWDCPGPAECGYPPVLEPRRQQDFRSWNRSRQQAERLLLENAGRILTVQG